VLSKKIGKYLQVGEFPYNFVLYLAVFKFVEPPENNEKPIDQKSRVKFKIMSLKVKGEMDYVPELVMYYCPSCMVSIITLYP